MSSGPDDAYRAECEAREVKALQRKHATGSAKRAVIQMLQEARVRLIAAQSTFKILDERVKADVGLRAFHDETDNLEYLLLRLDRMEKDVENMGVDLQEVCKVHKHHYATDDIDEGCTHCGIRRREGPIRP